MLYQTLIYQYLIIVEKYHLQYSIKLNIYILWTKMHVQLTSKALAPALIPLTTFPNKNDICAKDLSRKEKKNIYQNI